MDEERLRQRRQQVKDFFRQRLVDNVAEGRVHLLSSDREPMTGYSTHWVTSGYEELSRLMPKATVDDKIAMLEGLSNYQIDRYFSQVTQEQLDIIIERIAQSSYELTPAR